MAGVHVPVLRRTKLDLPELAGTANDYAIPLAQLVDSLDWVSGALLVRVYDKDFTGTNSKVNIGVGNTMVSPESPDVVVVADGPIASVEIASGTSSDPKLYTAAIPASGVIGRYLGVYLIVSPNNDAVSGRITLGIDLVGRSS